MAQQAKPQTQKPAPAPAQDAPRKDVLFRDLASI